MTTQPIASSHPAPSAPDPARHRRIRTAAAITGVAALIATGSYLATTIIGPDTAPPTPAAGTDVNPSAQTLRDLHQSIAGQHGGQAAPGTTVSLNAQVQRELHQSVAGQYRSRSAPDATVNPNTHVRRELRQSIASQYRSRSAPDATVNPNAEVQRELPESIAGQYGPAR
jgi:hypothetical protein